MDRFICGTKRAAAAAAIALAMVSAGGAAAQLDHRTDTRVWYVVDGDTIRLTDKVYVRLEADPHLDQVDRFGRLLRYVWFGGVNLNLELVREGAATVWFYGHDRGRYSDALLTAARCARAANKGLWGACDTVWDPYGPAITHQKRKKR